MVAVGIVFAALLQLTAVYTAPSIEACPADSIELDNKCICNPESCEKPPCPSILVIATNGTENPGSCCPTYACTECKEESQLDGKCPCAAGAVLNAKNKCECVDPEKHLIKDECVCNQAQCELPQLCDETSVLVVTDNQGCCKKTKCIQCPPDSYAGYRGIDEFEEKCVCYPCNKHECSVNQSIKIKRKATSFPGKCCDLYECTPLKVNSSCQVENNIYEHGVEWNSSNKQLCKCQNGLSLCTSFKDENLKNCLKDDKLYMHEESWLEDDACTNCTCNNGKYKCISYFCDLKEESKMKKNCPELLNCNKVCPNGFKTKKGCAICKCNAPKINPDLFQQFNLTESDLIKILRNYEKEKAVAEVVEEATTTMRPIQINPVLLQTYNISEEEIIEMLDERRRWMLNGETTTIEPTVVPNNYCNKNYYYIILLVVVISAIFAISVVLYCYKKQKGTNKKSMTISNHKYTTVHDNNNEYNNK